MLKNIKFLLVSSMLLSSILFPIQSIQAIQELWPFTVSSIQGYCSTAVNSLNNNFWSYAKKGTEIAADGVAQAAYAVVKNPGVAAAGIGLCAGYSALNSYLNQKRNNKILENAVVGSGKNILCAAASGILKVPDLAGQGVLGSAHFAWNNPGKTALLVGGCIAYNQRDKITEEAKKAYQYCKDNAGKISMYTGLALSVAGIAEWYRQGQQSVLPTYQSLMNAEPARRPAAAPDQEYEEENNEPDYPYGKDGQSKLWVKEFNSTPEQITSSKLQSGIVAINQQVNDTEKLTNKNVEKDVQEFSDNNDRPTTPTVTMKASLVGKTLKLDEEIRCKADTDYVITSGSSKDDKDDSQQAQMKNFIAKNNLDGVPKASTKIKVPSLDEQLLQAKQAQDNNTQNMHSELYDRAYARLNMIFTGLTHCNISSL